MIALASSGPTSKMIREVEEAALSDSLFEEHVTATWTWKNAMCHVLEMANHLT